MASRRSNKSHKVPNVKLRPAGPGTSTSATTARAKARLLHAVSLAEDSDDDGDNTTLDTCPRPFKGVVLCATGINDKATLFKNALELGAQPLSDLTDTVTHLIANEAGSAKYRCALERKIPIMQAAWVTDSFETWLRGDDVDLEASVEPYRLPIFTGVVLCLSGIDDVSTRVKINKLVTHQNGTYVKYLERPIRVTHLLCGGEGEKGRDADGLTEKMRYAEKFNRLGEARIQVVWEEWFWDSLEHGGRFDEAKYSITLPRPQRKTGLDSDAALPQPSSAPSFTPTSSDFPASHPARRAPHPPPSSSPSASPAPAPAPAPAAGPIPDTAGDLPTVGDEELIVSKRVPAQTLHLWESILRPRGFAIVDGRLKLPRSPSRTQATSASQGDALLRSPSPPALGRLPARASREADADGDGAAPGSLLSAAAFRRASSFAPLTRNASTPKDAGVALEKGRLPFRRTATNASTPSFFGGMRSSVTPGEPVGLAPQSSFLSAHPPRGSAVAGPVAGPSGLGGAPEAEGESEKEQLEKQSQLFAGLSFRMLGEARCANVRGAIEGHGGRINSDGDAGADDDDEADFIIVRLVSGSKLYHAEPDVSLRNKYRTECWLEQCIFAERLCLASEHVSFVPLTLAGPLANAATLVLSCSGLAQSEACWVRRLLRALGVELAPAFRRGATTHLLCPSATGAKADKAREWGVPVVGMRWLEELVKTGTVPPQSVFLAGEEGRMHLDEEIGDEGADPGALASKSKGKERAVDGVGKMVDITNSDSSRSHSHEADTAPKPAYSATDPADPLLAETGHMPEEAGLLSFGPPNELLGRAPKRRKVSTETPEPITLLDGAASSGPPSSLPFASSNPSILRGAQLAERGRQLRSDLGRSSPAPTPASRTPSPVKPSPARVPTEVTKALQESITNLLGKRSASTSEEDLANALPEVFVPAQAQVQRPRPRPVKRTRPPTRRQDSMGSLVVDGTERRKFTPVNSFDSATGRGSPAPQFEGANASMMEDVRPAGAVAGEGVLVTYEDVGQRDEKRRLMSLFGDGEGREVEQHEPSMARAEKAKGKLVRRTGRKPGF